MIKRSWTCPTQPSKRIFGQTEVKVSARKYFIVLFIAVAIKRRPNEKKGEEKQGAFKQILNSIMNFF